MDTYTDPWAETGENRNLDTGSSCPLICFHCTDMMDIGYSDLKAWGRGSWHWKNSNMNLQLGMRWNRSSQGWCLRRCLKRVKSSDKDSLGWVVLYTDGWAQKESKS